jgi:hypothetical protein
LAIGDVNSVVFGKNIVEACADRIAYALQGNELGLGGVQLRFEVAGVDI